MHKSLVTGSLRLRLRSVSAAILGMLLVAACSESVQDKALAGREPQSKLVPTTVSEVVLWTGVQQVLVTMLESPTITGNLPGALGATFGPRKYDITGRLVPVGQICNTITPAPFADAIALIERGGIGAFGTCTFMEKTIAAQNAGYIGVLIYGSATAPQATTMGTVVGAELPAVTIPALNTDRANGLQLASAPSGSITVRMRVLAIGPNMVLPDNITVSTDPGVCTAVVDPGQATATDWDDSPLPVTSKRVDGQPLTAPYPRGQNIVEWTAFTADNVGAQLAQIINVVDRERPTITLPDNITVNNDPGLATAVVNTGSATGADNCGGVTVTSRRSDSQAASAPFRIGVTSITWTVRDATGNTVSGVQTVTVRDAEPPRLFVPADMTVNATSANGALVTFAATATDNASIPSVSCSPSSGAQFAIGPSTVNCTATDAAGNSATGQFRVVVLGASDQLSHEGEIVTGLNLDAGTANALLNDLRTALSFATTNPHVACVKLGDFIEKVVKAGTAISATDSAALISDAQRVMAVIGC